MTRAERSALMARIRGDSLGPESRLAAALAATSLRGAVGRNAPDLPGRPDFALPGRLAVFVHGCFWHCCSWHFRLPRSRRAWWSAKFAANRARDRRARRRLRAMGYRTAVVWEHDLGGAAAAARVAVRLERRSAAAALGDALAAAGADFHARPRGLPGAPDFELEAGNLAVAVFVRSGALRPGTVARLGGMFHSAVVVGAADLAGGGGARVARRVVREADRLKEAGS